MLAGCDCCHQCDACVSGDWSDDFSDSWYLDNCYVHCKLADATPGQAGWSIVSGRLHCDGTTNARLVRCHNSFTATGATMSFAAKLWVSGVNGPRILFTNGNSGAAPWVQLWVKVSTGQLILTSNDVPTTNNYSVTWTDGDEIEFRLFGITEQRFDVSAYQNGSLLGTQTNRNFGTNVFGASWWFGVDGGGGAVTFDADDWVMTIT